MIQTHKPCLWSMIFKSNLDVFSCHHHRTHRNICGLATWFCGTWNHWEHARSLYSQANRCFFIWWYHERHWKLNWQKTWLVFCESGANQLGHETSLCLFLATVSEISQGKPTNSEISQKYHTDCTMLHTERRGESNDEVCPGCMHQILTLLDISSDIAKIMLISNADRMTWHQSCLSEVNFLNHGFFQTVCP